MRRTWRLLVGSGAVMAVAGVTLALQAASPASGASTAQIGLAPATQNVRIDADPFRVDVKVFNAQNLGAYQFTLTFNTGVLEYAGLAKGSFLNSTGRTGTCFPDNANSADVVARANATGAVTFGCTTLGFADGNSGVGPSGDGVLATLGFKPKGAGTSDLQFRGLDGPPGYEISPDGNNGEPEYGQTGMTQTGICQGEGADQRCTEDSIDVSEQNGVVQVYDPASGPEPTGVPATPTSIARRTNTNLQATVQAALGTPERRITDGTPPAGTIGGSGNAGAGGTAGTGSASGGSSSGAPRGSGSGSPGSGPGGSVAGASSGRSPAGAPVAGYGPQQQEASPWWQRAAIALAAMGVLTVGAGFWQRRSEAGERR
ncbi:MAG: hypothetical protein HYX50_05480 [Chloroflexi bacterium]|nr:hypothetical protein [Chloroflexota bacterium]